MTREGATAATDAPIALLGGTFDPVHYGHLRFADDVRRALGLREVRLVPSALPPHREPARAAGADRLAMLEVAVRDFPGLAVDPREIARGGRSYTVETLESLRREHPEAPLILLVGADAFRGLPAWHRWRELFDLAHVVVVPRPGSTLDDLPSVLAPEWQARHTADAQALRARTAGSIYVQPVAPHAISSTQIRNALAQGDVRSIDALLPAAVLSYIGSRRLYQLSHGTDPHPTHAS
ncbi:MAG TPA: nicotinate-nucleotide adenylyltransferase [Casimicrobiaceae bacterium]|nr:nicotinate-nucleotide adenylyltransferase [Casimicrobiaceae bacterium]